VQQDAFAAVSRRDRRDACVTLLNEAVEKFEEALIYATRAHANQTRKKTGIPFVAHILA